MSVHPYPRLARLAMQTALAGGSPDDKLMAQAGGGLELWSPQAGCFVSLKGPDGELRGCIGTISPSQENLGREIMANAVAAATRDPRFEPVTLGELEELDISVDILSTPEKINGPEELDPAVYGVIVEKGESRGLLLPALEGVDNAQQQVSIAAAKAGILDLRNVSLQRFTVQRYPEQR